ncbi:hypothetical protein JPSP33_00360 [Staphylococcus pseudintermedius]
MYSSQHLARHSLSIYYSLSKNYRRHDITKTVADEKFPFSPTTVFLCELLFFDFDIA